MRKIDSVELKENMRFTAPVFFDDGVYMLVDEGVPLQRRDLDALSRWNVPFVLTSGTAIDESKPAGADEEAGAFKPLGASNAEAPAPPESKGSKQAAEDAGGKEKKRGALGEASPDGKIDAAPSSLEDSRDYASYESAVASLDGLFEAIRKSDPAGPNAVDGIASGLRHFVAGNHAQAIRCVFGGGVSGGEMAKNAAHTAIISMIVAESLSISDTGVERILAGALLHDVGMLRMPDRITGKKGKLNNDEVAVIRSHAQRGYKIIIQELVYPDEVALVAAQHHEHWDGTGYPEGLTGEEISIQARIVSAADAFVAMVSPRSYRSKFSGYDAMKNLVADNARRYDPDIVKAMIQNIGIYPVGSIVLMSSAAIARVTQVYPGAPLRPVVKILVDEAGQSLPDDESETIDLRSNRRLFIVRAMSPQEL